MRKAGGGAAEGGLDLVRPAGWEVGAFVRMRWGCTPIPPRIRTPPPRCHQRAYFQAAAHGPPMHGVRREAERHTAVDCVQPAAAVVTAACCGVPGETVTASRLAA